MSERKVLTKYYPPDFDPSALGRVRAPKKAGPKVQTVRLMAPFSMKCTTCGEYIYKGRKFNARKEVPEGDKYLGIQIFRFYIRCTRCSAEITFRTDPKNQDYQCEKGAKRNTEPWRVPTEEETDEQRLDRLEAEEKEEEEKNAMVELEAKTVDAKREMAVADALDEIRTRNARLERADRDGAELTVAAPVDDEATRQEREDAEAARRAFEFARRQDAMEEEIIDDGESASISSSASGPAPATTNIKAAAASTSAAASTPSAAAPATSTDMPPPSFKRVVKKKKDHSALLGIKKKPA
ncbi:CWC16 protein [Microdochium bolleyi]|uniref:Splicing factor YJU2 n=1 Tax=Microdochium bolleyi TaxID=196109 RepID=A0A136J7D9_9PEZI|nr:CWC16 protein [Microdochium bolleyi]